MIIRFYDRIIVITTSHLEKSIYESIAFGYNLSSFLAQFFLTGVVRASQRIFSTCLEGNYESLLLLLFIPQTVWYLMYRNCGTIINNNNNNERRMGTCAKEELGREIRWHLLLIYDTCRIFLLVFIQTWISRHFVAWRAYLFFASKPKGFTQPLLSFLEISR